MRKIEEKDLLSFVQGTTEDWRLEFKLCLNWDDEKSSKSWLWR